MFFCHLSVNYKINYAQNEKKILNGNIVDIK